MPSDSPPPSDSVPQAGPCQRLWVSLHNGVAVGAGAGSSLVVTKTEAQRETPGRVQALVTCPSGRERLSQEKGAFGRTFPDVPCSVTDPHSQGRLMTLIDTPS